MSNESKNYGQLFSGSLVMGEIFWLCKHLDSFGLYTTNKE